MNLRLRLRRFLGIEALAAKQAEQHLELVALLRATNWKNEHVAEIVRESINRQRKIEILEAELEDMTKAKNSVEMGLRELQVTLARKEKSA